MPPFNSQTAAIAGHKGALSRWSRPQKPIESPPTPATITAAVDDFTVRKLARIRGQIDAVEKLLDDADEPQAVDRFANALTRLYDLERILAGRPLPGSRRPAAEGKRSTAAPTSGPWLPPEEHPAQVAQVPIAPPADPRPLGWEYDDPGAAACGVHTPTGSVLEDNSDHSIPQS